MTRKFTQHKVNISQISISRANTRLGNFLTMKRMKVKKIDEFYQHEEESDVGQCMMFNKQ